MPRGRAPRAPRCWPSRRRRRRVQSAPWREQAWHPSDRLWPRRARQSLPLLRPQRVHRPPPCATPPRARVQGRAGAGAKGRPLAIRAQAQPGHPGGRSHVCRQRQVAARPVRRCPHRVARARPCNGPPARGGSRRSRRARRVSARAGRASRRTGYGDPHAPPSVARRRLRPESAGDGSGNRRRQRSGHVRDARAGGGRVLRAASSPASRQGRAPARLRGGRSRLPRSRARAPGARPRRAGRAEPPAAPSAWAARRHLHPRPPSRASPR